MKGIISTTIEIKKRNSGEHKQVYVKDGGNEYKCVCLYDNMVSLIEVKIHFGLFLYLLDDINVENIVKLKLAHVRGINFVCSMTPKQSVLE